MHRLNAAVAICLRFRLSEDITLLVYTLMIPKNVRTGSAVPEWSFKNVRYRTINDENKCKSKDSKDHLSIYFKKNNDGEYT